MKLPDEPPCRWAQAGWICDMCMQMGVPCTGSFPDAAFSPGECDCYEQVDET